MPGGRPTVYKPEYCDEMIEYARTGGFYNNFAGRIGICVQTLYNWEKVHPEFLESKGIAKAACLHWWDERAREGLFDKSFNTTIWVFVKKNIDGWADKSEVKQNSNIEINIDSQDRDL